MKSKEEIMGEKTEGSNKTALVLAAISIVLSVGASILMSFWGATLAMEVELGTGEIGEQMRVGAFHPILIVFILFPVTGLIGILKERPRFLKASAIAMFLLCLLSFLGAGLVFLPASLLLIISAVVYKEKEK
jgi:glucan phosphoethanolaminetransferase (alkaline phosphatase superfamily)